MITSENSTLVCAGLAVIGFFVFSSAYSAYSAYNLKYNYEPVNAKIIHHKTECFIEVHENKNMSNGRVRYLSTKGRIKNACYDTIMSCNTASTLARKYGYPKSNIKQRVNITYRYQSPIDGTYHNGKVRIVEPSKKFMRRKKINILASKKHPFLSTFGDDLVDQIK